MAITSDEQWNDIAGCASGIARCDDDGRLEFWLMAGDPGQAQSGIETRQGGQQPVGNLSVDDDAAAGWKRWKRELVGLQVVEVVGVDADAEYRRILIWLQSNAYFSA